MGLFGIKNAFNQGLDDFKRTPNALLVDVRTPQEYAAGHVPGSVNLPVERIDTISWGTDRPLFVYCLSGARSGRACAWLKAGVTGRLILAVFRPIGARLKETEEVIHEGCDCRRCSRRSDGGGAAAPLG